MQLERALLQEPGQSQGAERAGAAHCTDAVAGVSGARPWGRAGAQRCWHHMHGRHWGVALLRCLGIRHWTVRTRSETRGVRARVLVSFLVLPRPNNYRGGTFMPPLRAATLQSSGPQRSLRSGDGRSDVKRGWCGCGGRDARRRPQGLELSALQGAALPAVRTLAGDRAPAVREAAFAAAAGWLQRHRRAGLGAAGHARPRARCMHTMERTPRQCARRLLPACLSLEDLIQAV